MLRFVAQHTAFVYKSPDDLKKIEQTIWGDEVQVKNGRREIEETKRGKTRRRTMVKVRARGDNGWMFEDELQDERLLEIIFVDIGQGDGCFLITPEGRAMVIDAGEGDNMRRFLNWRFDRFETPVTFECGVITHPDKDHYGGFDDLFQAAPKLRFETIYHNGLVERKAAKSSDQLGERIKHDGRTFQVDLIDDKAKLEALLAQKVTIDGKTMPVWERKTYPSMLKEALDNGCFDDIRMLGESDGYMPGYEDDKDLELRVLGPVVENAGGRPGLRRLGSHGKTKNGHSVVLKLRYREVTMLLGGDLNIPAEELLMAHHTGFDADDHEYHEDLVRAARRVFQVDVAKACHHGSHDFSDLWLEAVHPIATVISSGDDEPHAHPRAETIGALGRHSRGSRPLIFSTELARSAKENIKKPFELRRRIVELTEKIDAAPEATEADRKKQARLRKELDKTLAKLERSVAVYGAINVRTDGNEVLFAQKLERRAGSRKWDVYALKRKGGVLVYESKH